MQSEKRFVSYFDILGFSKFLESTDPEKVVKIIKELFSISAQISTAYIATERVNKQLRETEKAQPHTIIKNSDGRQIAIPNLDNATINSVMMFDSVVFWTSNNNEDDLYDLLDTCSLFMRCMLWAGFPVRGAIAYGDFAFSGGSIHSASTVQHFALASRAQAVAMRLESKQKWAGCVLHDSIITHCEQTSISLEQLETKRKIIKYPIPLVSDDGSRCHEVMYALIWQGQIETVFPEKIMVNIESALRERFSDHDKKLDTNVEEMIINTAKFINFTFPLPETV